MGAARSGAGRRRIILYFSVLAVVTASWIAWTMAVGVLGYAPPQRGAANGETPIGWLWRGAVHVHTVMSGDASGTVGEVAAAAKQAGLDFVVITDHSRAGRAEEPRRPRSIDGVLVIFGEEVSLDDGHLVAIGTANHRYTIGPSARQAIDDVRRLDGYSFAAHPDALATPWRGRLGALDGVEVVNLASAFEHLFDGSFAQIFRAALTYPANAAATLLLGLDRVPETIAKWDARTALGAEAPRPLSAIAAADAHGPQFLGMPTYEQALAAVTVSIWLADSPADLADRDRDAATKIVDALAAGRSAAVIGAAGTAPGFSFHAESAGEANAVLAPGEMGETDDSSWRLVATLGAPGNYRVELLRDGVPVAEQMGDTLTFTVVEPGTYRVQVFRTDGPAGAGLEGSRPWIVSNPIYLWPAEAIRRTRRFLAPPVPGPLPAVSLLSMSGWSAEADALSASAMAPLDGGLRWEFTVPRQEQADIHSALTWRPQEVTDWSDYRGLSTSLATEREWRIAIHLWTRDGSGTITTWEQVVPARPPESTSGVLWSAFRRLGAADQGVVPGSLTPEDLSDVAGVALLVTPFLMRPGTDTTIDVREFGLIGND